MLVKLTSTIPHIKASRRSCGRNCLMQSKNLNFIKPLLQTKTHPSLECFCLAKSLKRHGRKKAAPQNFLCVSVCLRWAYFQRANTSSCHFNGSATRSFSHSLLTRSETFLHTWPTLPLGSVCGDIIGRRASPFCETSLTFCHPRFFFSSRTWCETRVSHLSSPSLRLIGTSGLKLCEIYILLSLFFF